MLLIEEETTTTAHFLLFEQDKTEHYNLNREQSTIFLAKIFLEIFVPCLRCINVSLLQATFIQDEYHYC